MSTLYGSKEETVKCLSTVDMDTSLNFTGDHYTLDTFVEGKFVFLVLLINKLIPSLIVFVCLVYIYSFTLFLLFIMLNPTITYYLLGLSKLFIFIFINK